MSRAAHVALLIALLLLFAGCQTPGAPDVTDTPSEPDGIGEQETDAPPSGNQNDPTEIPTAGGDALADPPTDRLGWEDGHWHNGSIDVTAGDGLNETELDVVVSRSMARVERVRGLEFEDRVPVTVIDRSTYREQSGDRHDDALRRFDNGKFEAMFLVGNERDSIETQDETLGQSVMGYYSPARSAIVIVSDSPEPTLDGEGVLAHELVHALQDQHFDLSDSAAQTRDAHQGRNGLVEGDATYVQNRYESRCGAEWRCLSTDEGATGDAGDSGAADDGGSPPHFGIQFLLYFPYSDGPGFVDTLYDRGGWAAVDDAYADVPDGSTEVIHPERYSEWEPAAVEVPDRSSPDWDRVRPPGRPDYAVLGQSAIAASLAYTLVDDYNRSGVVSPTDVVNYRADGSVDPRDPYGYDAAAADGWAGGKLYVYENGDGASADSAYVWKTRWESSAEAREFATTWSHLVDHWGGERVGDDEWVVRDSEFAGAYRIQQDGDSVTVVGAPERAAFSAVHGA